MIRWVVIGLSFSKAATFFKISVAETFVWDLNFKELVATLAVD